MTRCAAVLLVAAALACAEEPLRLERTIPLEGVRGRLDHMALDAKGKHLYVAALGNGTVEDVDLEAGRKLEPIETTKEPQGVLVLPDGRIVVTSGGDNAVYLVTLHEEMSRVVAQPDDADNVRLDAASGLVYVGAGAGELVVIDPKQAAKVASIKLDAHPESFQLESKGDRIFVNVPARKEVEVVDRRKREVVARWALDAEANFPMALDEDGHRLLVGCRKPAKILVLDTKDGKTVATLAAPGDADDIFRDGATDRLFVSGGEGKVLVYRKDETGEFKIVSIKNTAPGARTSLLSPDGSHLFVAVPEKEDQAAEIRVYAVGAAEK